MCFKGENSKSIEISHAGNEEILQREFGLAISLDKWLNDERWRENKSDFNKETLDMEYLKKEKLIYIVTDHIDILTVDKRALYIMTIEIADAVEGTISEDETETWLSVDEFKLNMILF